jgi:hypothetical protein
MSVSPHGGDANQRGAGNGTKGQVKQAPPLAACRTEEKCAIICDDSSVSWKILSNITVLLAESVNLFRVRS